MDTIEIKIDFDGEVKINNEYTANAPIEMTWFPNNDLIIETQYEKIVFNSASAFSGTCKKIVSQEFSPQIPLDAPASYIIKPKKADKNLTIVKDIKLQLMKNNVAHYIVINDKFAYLIKGDLPLENQ